MIKPKTSLTSLSKLYTVLRNFIWIAFLFLAFWKLFTIRAYAFNPIPVEIHIPTGEDFVREYEEIYDLDGPIECDES